MEDERSIVDATGKLAQAAIYIDDSPFLNIVELRSKAKRLHLEDNIDLIIVDYMGLMLQRGDNNVQEMSEITRSLKLLARDLDVPLLALSQLSRAPELRTNHRPQLSDLRESGSIEQDADVVAFIYREDTYTSREEWEKREPTRPYPENVAEIIVSKHRNGPLGTIPLYFRSDTVRFESLDPSPTGALEYA